MDDDNLDEIAFNIFNNPIKPPKSIFLDLSDVENCDIIKFNDILLQIVLKGIKILDYGNIFYLNKEQFNTINLYCQSFGFKLIVKCNNTEYGPYDSIFNESNPICNYQIYFESI